ncbi:unnamed protein product [Rhizophagus irregularis]|nr:unnamed protein product [Rhizophagus irregularis]
MFSGNCIIDELLASTIFNNNQQHLIADYMNNNTNINPFKVYKFIEKHLHTYRIEIKWIPYSQIKNLRKIAEGGFSIIYKAIWVDGSLDRDVAIKRLHNSQNISKYFLDELKSFCQLNNKGCVFHLDFVRPEITNDTPECFANLMIRCWDSNPSKRPTIDEIYGSAIDWKYMCSYFYDMPLLFEIIEEFQQAEETRLELTQLKKLGPEFSEQSHQKAIYTSRALSSFISKPINLSSMTSSNMKQEYITKEYEFDINNIQSLSSNNINSAEQCSFNSQY